jgi:hypothetical protein
VVIAREPEEKATTAILMIACVIGSVFILKANFMLRANGQGRKRKNGLKGECL